MNATLLAQLFTAKNRAFLPLVAAAAEDGEEQVCRSNMIEFFSGLMTDQVLV